MNDERFLRFQRSVDDDILEEAAAYRKQKVSWLRYAAIAACFCGVIAGVLAWHPWDAAKNTAVMASSAAKSADSAAAYSVYATQEAAAPAEAPQASIFGADSGETGMEAGGAYDEAEAPAFGSVMTFGAALDEEADNSMASAAIPNPVRECTLDELALMGYDIVLPEGAEAEFISVIDDMANVRFVCGGCEYLFRALKTDTAEDISGVYDTVRKALSWSGDGTDFEIREGSEGIVFSWYSQAEGKQYCLFSREAGPEAIMKTAGEIRGAEIPVPQE